MQKALLVDLNERCQVENLNQFLSDGWVVEKMTAFHPSVAVATGSNYSSPRVEDRGAILVIIENLGVSDV